MRTARPGTTMPTTIEGTNILVVRNMVSLCGLHQRAASGPGCSLILVIPLSVISQGVTIVGLRYFISEFSESLRIFTQVI